jgi:hypothetical protein
MSGVVGSISDSDTNRHQGIWDALDLSDLVIPVDPVAPRVGLGHYILRDIDGNWQILTRQRAA